MSSLPEEPAFFRTPHKSLAINNLRTTVPSLRAMTFGILATDYNNAQVEQREADLVQIVSELPAALMPELFRRVWMLGATHAYNDVMDVLDVVKDEAKCDHVTKAWDKCNDVMYVESVCKRARVYSEHRVEDMPRGSLTYGQCVEAAQEKKPAT